MLIKNTSKVAEVILNHHILILPFEHFGINLSFGEKNISEISREFNINENLITSVLNLFLEIEPKDFTFNTVDDLRQIIIYLKNCHLYYIEEKLPSIEELINQITSINNCSEITLLKKFFSDYKTEVANHLKYENEVVHPYIEYLITLLENKDLNNENTYSVLVYKDFHDDIEEKLNDLKNLLIKYIPISNDQQIRRKLLFELFEFDSDLNIHSKIEEKILIPLVEKLENNLKEYNATN